MQPKIIEKYFFFGLLLTTLIFTFFIFRPFWIVLVLGASFAIILYPVHEWLNKKHLPNWLASFLTLLFFVIVLCIPLFSIGSIVFNQSQNLYHSVINNGNSFPFINEVGIKINSILPSGVYFDINQKISSLISLFTNNIANIFTATVSALLSFVLMLLAIFYFLKDGNNWRKTILRLSPLSDTDDEKIINKLSQTINGVMKGTLFIAIVQGILMAIGLTIFGVQNAAIWGVVAAITSLIPTVGTAIVSIPAIIFLFVTGYTFSAVGLLVWATIVVGTIDNFLTPYIIGNKISIPPFLILFSVLGGIALLGPVGVLIGPLTVSLLYTLIEMYQSQFN
ncbi:AI-2E family transporter [Candidatus Nomurabacteria bacterium]|nr:AI-2E family transporter [Candidatus Nomurabacteria bacterium]